MTIIDRIERARRAQQRHEQTHDVQLELGGTMEPNDRIFVSTSSMAESVAVAWAAASSGILSPDDRDRFTGELLIHMDGCATIKWWDNDYPYVLVIDPERRNGSYVSVYMTEDQPPDEDLEAVWTVEKVVPV